MSNVNTDSERIVQILEKIYETIELLASHLLDANKRTDCIQALPKVTKMARDAERFVRIQAALEENPGASQREIARHTGIHLSTVNKIMKSKAALLYGENASGHVEKDGDDYTLQQSWSDRRNYT